MGKGLFITGTDTGVGKTLVAGGLAAVLHQRGINIGVMKPAESGCSRKDGKLIPQDALFLREMAGCADDLRLINPYAFERPISPAQAAESEGLEIKLEVIRDAYDTLRSRHELVLVEGAGGLLAPLNLQLFMADLPVELGNIPILVVCRDILGTINHTLLTIHYARTKGIEVIGMVLNRQHPPREIVDCNNSYALQRWANVPLLGTMQFLPQLDRESITKAVKSNLNIEPILSWRRS
jgi:dethiobiotin synthetase